MFPSKVQTLVKTTNSREFSPVPGWPSPGAFSPPRCAVTGSVLAWKGSGLYSALRPDVAASRGRGLSARCAASPSRRRTGATGATVNRGGLSCAMTRHPGGDQITKPRRQGSARRCQQPTRPVKAASIFNQRSHPGRDPSPPPPTSSCVGKEEDEG